MSPVSVLRDRYILRLALGLTAWDSATNAERDEALDVQLRERVEFEAMVALNTPAPELKKRVATVGGDVSVGRRS